MKITIDGKTFDGTAKECAESIRTLVGDIESGRAQAGEEPEKSVGTG